MAKDWIRPMPRAWWLTRRTWRVFMLRELTSAFVAAYAAFLLLLLLRAREAGDPASTVWTGFVECLSSPWSLAFHGAVLAMALLHTATWFVAAPKALRLFRGEEPVPERIVVGAHFAAWFGASLLVAWLVLG